MLFRIKVGKKKCVLELDKGKLTVEYDKKLGMHVSRETLLYHYGEAGCYPAIDTGSFIVNTENATVKFEPKTVTKIRKIFAKNHFTLADEEPDFDAFLQNTDHMFEDMAVVAMNDVIVAAISDENYYFEPALCTPKEAEEVFTVPRGCTKNICTNEFIDNPDVDRYMRAVYGEEKAQPGDMDKLIKMSPAELEYFTSRAFKDDLIGNHHKRPLKGFDYDGFMLAAETCALRFGVIIKGDKISISDFLFMMYDAESKTQMLTVAMRDYFDTMWCLVDAYEDQKTWLHRKYKGFAPGDQYYSLANLIITKGKGASIDTITDYLSSLNTKTLNTSSHKE